MQIKNGEDILPYSRWQAELNVLRQKYRDADPFPHIVLENFLQAETAEEAAMEFPAINSEDWIHYVHINEKKFGKTDRSTFGPTLWNIVGELNSDRFIRFLSELTGIKGLFADESLEGGGLHQSGRGGFLNIHADFTVHPHHRDWRRQVNVLVYLNKNWKDEYGGHLELWDRKVKRRAQKVAPIFNRCVIFTTGKDTFHGHPEPMTCPAEVTRKSIALYYFTKESAPFVRSTEYRARPGDGVKHLWAFLDTWVLRFYDAVKRRIGFSDRFASNILKFLHSQKQDQEDE